MKRLRICAALAAVVGGMLWACSATEDSQETTTSATIGCEEIPPLTVTKTAEPKIRRQWHWTIEKTAVPAKLTLCYGESAEVKYTVKVSDAFERSLRVDGVVDVSNPAPMAANLVGLVDKMRTADPPGEWIDVPLSCDGGLVLPLTLESGEALHCTYSQPVPDTAERINRATARTEGDVPGSFDRVKFDFDEAEIEKVDRCVRVEDTMQGELAASLCKNDSPMEFVYEWVSEPFEVCGTYEFENTATYTTNTTETTDSATATVVVEVPCVRPGCTLTQGYWKNHPEDEAWGAQAGRTFYLSGKTVLEALMTPPKGNAYYILAKQYIAAMLNMYDGANVSEVSGSLRAALKLFQEHTPDEIGALHGGDALRSQFIALAEILDDFNNGRIGPGHCED